MGGFTFSSITYLFFTRHQIVWIEKLRKHRVYQRYATLLYPIVFRLLHRYKLRYYKNLVWVFNGEQRLLGAYVIPNALEQSIKQRI